MPLRRLLGVEPDQSARHVVVKEIRALMLIGGPILITQLLQISAVVVDTIMAGNASAQDLSGVAIGSSIWVPLFLTLLGLLSALTPTISHLDGAGNHEGIPNQVQQSGWILLVLLPFCFLLIYNLEPLFLLLRVDAEILPIALGYIEAMAWGLPAVMGYNILRFYCDGLSVTRIAMYASIVGLCINIPLNYALIFGRWGLPEMGGVGCGWASAISYWVMFLFVACYVSIVPRFAELRLFKRLHPPRLADIKALLQLGIPIGIAFMVETSAFSIISLFLAVYGAGVVASHQIALNVASLTFMVPLSIGLAQTIRVGYLLGAGRPVDARRAAATGMLLCFAFGLASALVLSVFGYQIAALYNPDEAVRTAAATLLVLAALFQLADSVQVSAAGALRGYKDTRVPMLLVTIAFWVVCIPLGYVLGRTDWLGHNWQAQGFWIGLVCGLLAAGLLLTMRLYRISARHVAKAERVRG